ncbi:uncharacterized protein [Nicotiana tomentosiformis]|uniref:uncharacterized protein n=1 Tax=Nicotiana tomentosiformis TaxID=4098 RepID=UPI00388C4C58
MLSRHATVLIPSEEERVRIFIDGLQHGIRLSMAKEAETMTSFHQAVEIARRIERICSETREMLKVWGGGHSRHGRPRGKAQSSGGQARSYVFPGRTEAVSSDAVIIGIVTVFHIDASILFDPSSTYSYVSSYFASCLDMARDSLATLVHVFTPVGDSIMVDLVYQSCVVTMCGFEMRADFLLLDMVDFDVILSMDWLSSYHNILDCHSKTVMLAMPGLPRLGRGSLGHTSSKVILFWRLNRWFRRGVWCI